MVQSIHQKKGRRLLAAAAAGTAFALAIVGCSAAAPAPESTSAARSEADERFQRSLDGLVEAGFPAALGTRTTDDGGVAALASGSADLESERAAAADEQVRIGSNTKMFTSVVVMQLVDEGTVALDEPIETYLPGLLRGEGIDGTVITVRQLLQHTSGLPEYTDDLFEIGNGFADYRSPRDLLDLALTAPADFAPGERWQYSNTNYLTLGLMIERLTGNPYELEVHERIIEPLGLDSTVAPRGGERGIPGKHPLGYHLDPETEELVDATELDPGPAWAAGSMISTPSELNEFMQALFDGELTSAESLQQMLTTVPADDEVWPGSKYGLGVQAYPLSCGGFAWGHGGDIPGFETRNAVTESGDAVTIAVTALPWAFIPVDDEEALLDGYRMVFQALDDALCAA